MKLRARVALVTSAGVMASASGLAAAGAASADYGQGAMHEVEISANLLPNSVFGTGTGGGIWLWIELSGTTTGGTGDYTGSDCLHRTLIGPTGAASDAGDVTWTSDGQTIRINGVVIGGDIPVTITVPESGHESTDLGSVFSAPVGGLPGTAQVEVAP